MIPSWHDFPSYFKWDIVINSGDQKPPIDVLPRSINARSRNISFCLEGFTSSIRSSSGVSPCTFNFDHLRIWPLLSKSSTWNNLPTQITEIRKPSVQLSSPDAAKSSKAIRQQKNDTMKTRRLLQVVDRSTHRDLPLFRAHGALIIGY